jgi:3D (Asp-Asp-Asp) domain-containing protein
VINVRATAYCPCPICCGKSDGITSSGVKARADHTIAVDPALIPIGSQVYLDGIGSFVAEDTGGVISGAKIDLFMTDHQQALVFGVKYLHAYVSQESI